MNKKVYICPIVKAVKLFPEHHLLEESHPGVDSWQTARELRNSGWDDDEEEDNTGGWFQ